MKKSHIFITLMVLIMSSCASRENVSATKYQEQAHASLMRAETNGSIR